MNDPQEQWKVIPGFTNYEVSNYGGLYSIRNSCLLCLRPDENGYMRTEIADDNGEQKQIRVHILVMLAFSGPPPDLHRVNHKNGVKYDNRWTNLEYTTSSENTTHAYRTGLKKSIRGDAHWKTIIPDSDFDKIKSLYASGMTMKEIGAKYGVSKTPVRNIIRGVRRVASSEPPDSSVGAKKRKHAS